MNRRFRLTALILALAMLLSMIPFSAFAAGQETPHCMWAYDDDPDSDLYDGLSVSVRTSTSGLFYYGTRADRGDYLQVTSVVDANGLIEAELVDGEESSKWVNLYINRSGETTLTVTTVQGEVYTIPVWVEGGIWGFVNDVGPVSDDTGISHGVPFDYDQGDVFYFVCSSDDDYIPRDAMEDIVIYVDKDKENWISCELIEDGTRALREETVENCYLKFTVDTETAGGDFDFSIEWTSLDKNGKDRRHYNETWLTGAEKPKLLWSHRGSTFIRSRFSNSAGDCFPAVFYYGTSGEPGNALEISSAAAEKGLVSVGSVDYDDDVCTVYLYFDKPGTDTLTITTADEKQYSIPVSIWLPEQGFTSASGEIAENTVITHGLPFVYSAENTDFYFISESDWSYIPRNAMSAVDKDNNPYFSFSVNGGDDDWVSCTLVEDGTRVVNGETVENCYFKFTVDPEKAVGRFIIDLRFAGYDAETKELYYIHDFTYLNDNLEHLYFARWWADPQEDAAMQISCKIDSSLCGNFFLSKEGRMEKLTDFDSISSSDDDLICYEGPDDDGDLRFTAGKSGYAVLTVAAGENSYTIPVYISLPDYGYSTEMTLTEDTYINSGSDYVTYTASQKTFYYIITDPEGYIPKDALTRKGDDGKPLFTLDEECASYVSCRLVKNGSRTLQNGTTVDNYVIEFTVDTKKAPPRFYSGFEGLHADSIYGGYCEYGHNVEVVSGTPALYVQHIWYNEGIVEDGTLFGSLANSIGSEGNYLFSYGPYYGDQQVPDITSIKSKNDSIVSAEKASAYIYDFDTDSYVDVYEGTNVWCLNFNGVGTTELTLTDAGRKTYKFSVTTCLPDGGFYSQPVRSEKNLLIDRSVAYIPGGTEDLVFYYIYDDEDCYIGENGTDEDHMELSAYNWNNAPVSFGEYLQYELVSMNAPITLDSGETADRYMIKFTVDPAFFCDENPDADGLCLRYSFSFSDIWEEGDCGRHSGFVYFDPHRLLCKTDELRGLLSETAVSKDGKDVPIGSYWMKSATCSTLSKALLAAENVMEKNLTFAAYDAALTALEKATARFDESKDIKEGTAVPADWLEYYEDPDDIDVTSDDYAVFVYKNLGLKQKFTIPVRTAREDGGKPTEAIQWSIVDEDWCYEDYDNYNSGCITFKDGVATGKSVGMVCVEGRIANGQHVRVLFTVEAYPAKIALDTKGLPLTVGETGDVRVIVTPANATYAFDVNEFTFSRNAFAIEQDNEDDCLFHITLTSAEGASAKENITITEHNSGKTAKLPVTVGVPANTVTTTLKSTDIGLLKGGSTTLKAVAAIEGSKLKPINTAVTWTSSDPSVATVDAKGKVVAQSLGSCTIIAEPVKGTGSLEFAVSVTPKLKSFTLCDEAGKKLSKLSAVAGGDPVQLSSFITEKSILFDGVTAEEAEEFYTISYATTAPASVAQLDAETGELSVNGAGSAKVTVTLQCGSQKKTVNLTVTIGQAADIVTTTMKADQMVIAGKTVTLKAAAAIAGSKAKPISTAVLWESDNPEVATVDSKGKVTTQGLGSCTITAAAELAAPGTEPLAFRITVVPQLKSFTLYDEKTKLSKLEMEQYGSVDFRQFITENSIVAGGYDLEEGEHYSLSFVSSNENAAVFSDGVLEGLVPGKVTATVIITCGAVSKSVKVTVTVLPAAALPMLVESLVLYDGEEQLTELTLAPDEAVDISAYITDSSLVLYEEDIPAGVSFSYDYRSADETVAAFSGSVLTALAEGETTIYVDVSYGRPNDSPVLGATAELTINVEAGESGDQLTLAEEFIMDSDFQRELEEDFAFIGHEFPSIEVEPDEWDIDQDAFILEGAESIWEIETGSVVSVYVKGDGSVGKVQVSTQACMGIAQAVSGDRKTAQVHGKTLSISDKADDFLFDENSEDAYQFFLNYEGKVYTGETLEGVQKSTGLVVSASAGNASAGILDKNGATVSYTLSEDLAADYSQDSLDDFTGSVCNCYTYEGEMIDLMQLTTDTVSSGTVISDDLTINQVPVTDSTVIYLRFTLGDDVQYMVLKPALTAGLLLNNGVYSVCHGLVKYLVADAPGGMGSSSFVAVPEDVLVDEAGCKMQLYTQNGFVLADVAADAVSSAQAAADLCICTTDADGTIISIDSETKNRASGCISDAGIFDQKYVSEQALIFVRETNAWVSDYWSPVSLDDLLEYDLNDIYYMENSSHVISAMVCRKSAEYEEPWIMVYSGWTSIGKTKAVVSFLTGSTVTTGVCEASVINGAQLSAGDVVLASIQNGKLMEVEPATGGITISATNMANFSNDVYTPDGSTFYVLWEGASVIVIGENGQLSPVEAASLEDYKTASITLYDEEKILYDEADGEYDLVIVDLR